jgi:glutaredoxin
MSTAHEVIVYSRPNCHLCHNAISLLAQFGVQPAVVDIDGDDELRLRYGEWVPVVVIDGVERFRGHVDPRLLRRILI